MCTFLERRNSVIARPIVRDIEKINAEDSENQLLSLCFVPNPVTGRPDSTISLMLSEKERPQVREFIAQNLFTTKRPDGFDNVEDAEVFADDWHNQYGSECDGFRQRLLDYVGSLRNPKDE